MKQFGDLRVLQHCSAVKHLMNDGTTRGPVSVEFHLTNGCNQSCPWCIEAGRRGEHNTLPEELVIKTIRDLRDIGAEGIVWEGGGEPTLSPVFGAAMREANKRGFHQGLTTNGYGLSKSEIRLGVHVLDWIRISISGGKPATYAKHHGVDEYKWFDLMDHIDQTRERNPDLTMGWSYIVSDQDEEDISNVVVHAARLGMTYVQFKPLQVTPMQSVRPHPKTLEFIEDLAREVKDVKIYVSRMDADPYSHGACRAHHFVTQIGANGKVYPCCNIASLDYPDSGRDVSDLILGDLYHEDVYEIWSGDRRREITKRLLDPKVVARCPPCRSRMHNAALAEVVGQDTSYFL